MAAATETKTFPPIGMGPETWGPIFWTTMHIVTLGYPASPSAEEKAGAAAFFNSLRTMIPCPICREHYGAFLAESPVEAATHSRDALVFWAFALHNKVNDRLGKRQISWEEFITHMRALSASGHTRLPSRCGPSPILSLLVGGAALFGIGAAAYILFRQGRGT